MSWATRIQHIRFCRRHRARKAAYGAPIARINLHFSDELYAAIVRQARKVGLSPAAFSRERIAFSVGHAEAVDELEELRREVAALRRRLTELDGRDA